MVVTNRTKKYPRLVRLVSHVVGTRRREEAVTDKSEESRMKAAVVMVEPMVAPSCEMLRAAAQPDSKATLEPAKLGAYSSIRPLQGHEIRPSCLIEILRHLQCEKEETGYRAED